MSVMNLTGYQRLLQMAKRNPAQEINRELARLARKISPDSRLMQITLIRIGTKIVNDAKRNAQQVMTMRTGKLLRSINFRFVKDGIEIGTFGIPYGRIQEFGGVITPRRRAFLTIPADKPFENRSALSFDLKFGRIPKPGGKPYLLTKQGRAAYRLVRRVELKPRPFLGPAIKKNEQFAIEIIQEALATGE